MYVHNSFKATFVALFRSFYNRDAKGFYLFAIFFSYLNRPFPVRGPGMIKAREREH